MNFDRMLSNEEVAQARQRRLEAMKLQEIEGNPLTAEEVAMFEMFERERWPHERRRAYILSRARKLAAE
jgi:Fic family protein